MRRQTVCGAGKARQFTSIEQVREYLHARPESIKKRLPRCAWSVARDDASWNKCQFTSVEAGLSDYYNACIRDINNMKRDMQQIDRLKNPAENCVAKQTWSFRERLETENFPRVWRRVAPFWSPTCVCEFIQNTSPSMSPMEAEEVPFNITGYNFCHRQISAQ